jgi:hypothetical protein
LWCPLQFIIKDLKEGSRRFLLARPEITHTTHIGKTQEEVEFLFFMQCDGSSG